MGLLLNGGMNMEWFEMYDKDHQPDFNEIAEYIDHPLWKEFGSAIAALTKLSIRVDYSGCSLEKGWNLKFRKGSKSICTVYPKRHFFRVMVSIKTTHPAFKKVLDVCSEDVKEIIENTPFMNGSKWLVMDVKDKEIYDDVVSLVSFRIQTWN